ncbi:hypothetical protein EPI10_002955 [Gossypium australe]|uniref:Uncharacterized protein n=1 Tax=Gossypium australe TaxID=47621 RepID=A0A5B6VG34_9ROSI|nr:hypothetical protein EPI10_002955 [Gossypium australe]
MVIGDASGTQIRAIDPFRRRHPLQKPRFRRRRRRLQRSINEGTAIVVRRRAARVVTWRCTAAGAVCGAP